MSRDESTDGTSLRSPPKARRTGSLKTFHRSSEKSPEKMRLSRVSSSFRSSEKSPEKMKLNRFLSSAFPSSEKSPEKMKLNRFLSSAFRSFRSSHEEMMPSAASTDGSSSRTSHEETMPSAASPDGSSYEPEGNEQFSMQLKELKIIDPTCDVGWIDFSADYGEQFIQYVQYAQYAKVATSISKETIKKLFTKTWDIRPPGLILSVTGGDKSLDLSNRIKERLKKGIIKAARSTDAWIMTSGTNKGITKIVGEAVRDHKHTGKNRLVVLGIAFRKCVEDIVKPPTGSASDRESPLEPHHTHFLLVDNGIVQKWESEIEFRASVEKSLADAHKVPVCLLAVGGGEETLNAIHSATSKRIPTIVIKGSGGMADVLALAVERTEKEISVFQNAGGCDVQQVTGKLSDECLKEVQSLLKQKGLTSQRLLGKIRDIVFHPDLVTVFYVNSKDSNLDFVIQESLLKVNQVNELDTALKWNRADVAKKIISSPDRIWDIKKMHEPMMAGLIKNQVEFVDMYLDAGVNLQDFLTFKRLEQLYNEAIDSEMNRAFNKVWRAAVRPKDNFKLEHIGLVIEKLLGHFYVTHYKEEKYIFEGTTPHARELFIWAVLFNFRNISRLFWQEGKQNIPAALFARKVSKAMRRWTLDIELQNSLKESASEYEGLAVDLLNKCYNKNAELTLSFLTRKNKHWGDTSCILLAARTSCRAFIRQAACQSLLNRIWKHPLNEDTNVFTIMLAVPFPFLLCFIETQELKENEQNPKKKMEGHEENIPSKDQTGSPKRDTTSPGSQEKDQEIDMPWIKKCQQFYTSPIVTFFMDMLFYILFLLLYSYILIVQLTEEFHWLEVLLFVWAFSYFLEEFHTVWILYNHSLRASLALYVFDKTNILDCLNMATFIVGFLVRYLEKDGTLIWARIILSINCAMFFLRVLHASSINEYLGPMVIMVHKMFKDLMSFLVILLVFFLAFTVMSEAILYPNTPFTPYFVWNLPRKAYWQIYGELFLETLDGVDCTDDPDIWLEKPDLRCPTKVGRYLVPIFLACYILISNVLLLNLLIALFNFSVQKVYDSTEAYWSMLRFKLIYEYSKRPCLPPPFILFGHLWELGKYIFRKCRECCGHKTDDSDKFCTPFNHKKEKLRMLAWENFVADSFMAPYWESIRPKKEEESEEANKVTIENTVRWMLQEQKMDKQVDKQTDKSQSSLAERINNHSEKERVKGTTVCICSKVYPTSAPSSVDSDTENKKRHPDFLEELAYSNFRSRISPYHGTNVERTHVDDDLLKWEVEVDDSQYSPVCYTSEEILKQPIYADPDILKLLPDKREEHISFNKDDRTSYCGPYKVVDGLPLNPIGRTGLRGRGSLGRWGPNKCFDPIITRWKRVNEDDQSREKRQLEFLAVLRKDSYFWSFPGGYEKTGSSPLDNLKVKILSKDGTQSWKPLLEKTEVEIYKGYADDPLNTDNAWKETKVISYHDDDGSILEQATFTHGEDVSQVAWQTASHSVPLWGIHAYFLRLVATNRLDTDY